MQRRCWPLVCLVLLPCLNLCAATVLETIGVTAVRNEDPTLTGSGVRAAQPEATEPPSHWQVNPDVVGQPVNLFTWISGDGSSTSYPNSLGTESGHANAVGNNFYSPAQGAAPGILSLDNYEASHFAITVVPSLSAIRARVVSQSFVGGVNLPLGQSTETHYDNYVATHNTVIVSGAGNGGPPQQPSTAYNLISVAAFGGASSVGPTTNGGRAKPDITAPAGATSYSTPLVGGVAALLFQAAARNDAGAGTAATATNAATLKALLLNGAVKPANWTNGPASPLDARHGAGVVNAYNSWRQLSGGKHAFIETTSPSAGGSHLPGGNPNSLPVMRGWDFNSVASGLFNDGVNHYYFTLDAAQATRFSLTATLVWQRRLSQAGINNLDLFLYNTADHSLVASGQSGVDNVEHLFLAGLPAGRYDLQVLKRGGLGTVSASENYALAFDFAPVKLNIALAGTAAIISWPVSAAGFNLQSSSNLSLANGWSQLNNTPVQSNGWFIVRPAIIAGPQFFRLKRP